MISMSTSGAVEITRIYAISCGIQVKSKVNRVSQGNSRRFQPAFRGGTGRGGPVMRGSLPMSRSCVRNRSAQGPPAPDPLAPLSASRRPAFMPSTPGNDGKPKDHWSPMLNAEPRLPEARGPAASSSPALAAVFLLFPWGRPGRRFPCLRSCGSQGAAEPRSRVNGRRRFRKNLSAEARFRPLDFPSRPQAAVPGRHGPLRPEA